MNDHPEPPGHLKPVTQEFHPSLAPRFSEAWQAEISDSGFAAAADSLMHDAVTCRASDVHLDPARATVRVRFRIDGVLHTAAQVPPIEGLQIIRHLQVRAGIDAATQPDVHDGHARLDLDQGEVNLRVASIPTLFGDKLSIRILDPSRVHLSLEALGFGEEDEKQLRTWLAQATGMLLATGPTGAGKTTTLYALLTELSRTNRNIISLEDPVELSLGAITQVQVSGGTADLSFAEGLTRVLRHDPDVLAVGEIRDAGTARIAIHAALSGHALLSSLSAHDVAGTISLLRNLGMEDYQICAAVRVIISQRTLRLLCEKCRQARELAPHERAWFDVRGAAGPEKAFDSDGCDHCLQTGCRGVSGVFELWAPDETGYDLILGHADEKQLRHHLRQRGIRSLRERALDMAREGRIALRDAMWNDQPDQGRSH